MNLDQALSKITRLHYRPVGTIIDRDKYYEMTLAYYRDLDRTDASWWVMIPENSIALVKVTLHTNNDGEQTFIGQYHEEWPFPREGMWIDAIGRADSYMAIMSGLREFNRYYVRVMWEDGTLWTMNFTKSKTDFTTGLRVALTKDLMRHAKDLQQARKILGLCEF